jgi:hypothetical protein
MINETKLIKDIRDSGYDSFLYSIKTRNIYLDSEDVNGKKNIEFVGGTGGIKWSHFDINRIKSYNNNGSQVKCYLHQIRNKNLLTWFDLFEPNPKKFSWMDDKKYLEYICNNEEKKDISIVPSINPVITRFGKYNVQLASLIEKVGTIAEPYKEPVYLQFNKDTFRIGLVKKYNLEEQVYRKIGNRNIDFMTIVDQWNLRDIVLFQKLDLSRITDELNYFKTLRSNSDKKSKRKEIEDEIEKLKKTLI